MLRSRLGGSVLAALMLPLGAQTGTWSPEFSAPGIAGHVSCFTTFAGQLHAGGSRFSPRGQVLDSIARFDGVLWQPLGSGMDAGSQDALVLAMVEFQGELIAAGRFVTAGGVPAVGIAAWNGTTWRPLGSGLTLSFGSAEVEALAVYQGALYAAGYFDTAGGQQAVGFARWNGSTWSAVGTGFREAANNTLARPRTMLVANGLLYIGGTFNLVDGRPAGNLVAFDGTTFGSVGGGMDFGVYALAAYGSDVVAGGNFNRAGGVLSPMIAAWNGTAWRRLGTNGPDLPVSALHAFGTELYAGGGFYNVGDRLARFDGTTWSDPGGVSGLFQGIIDSRVDALHVFGSELIVGGHFTRAGAPPEGAGAVVSVGVVAFDGGTRYRQVGPGLGIDGVVHEMVAYENDIVAVGNFIEAGAVNAVGVARFDGDRWLHMGAFDGPVQDATVWRGQLIVSGGFRNIDGQPIAGIARYDGSRWQPFGPPRNVPLVTYNGDVYAGDIGQLVRFDGTSFVPVASMPGIVTELHVHTDGRLYAATNTATSRRVFSYDGAQAIQIGTADDGVDCLASWGTDLAIGGRFGNVNGVAATRIALWNGSTWRPMPTQLHPNTYSVNSLVELEGDLYAGASGEPRGFAVRFRAGAWEALAPTPSGVPQALFADRATSSIWAGGDWFTIGGLPSRNFSVWRNQPAWHNRLHGLAGTGGGVPLLLGRGELRRGTPFQVSIEAQPQHAGVLALGFARVDVPLLGGHLVPRPDVLVPLVGDARGVSGFGLPWPPGVPTSTAVFLQGWVLDAGAVGGLSATNALQATVP